MTFTLRLLPRTLLAVAGGLLAAFGLAIAAGRGREAVSTGLFGDPNGLTIEDGLPVLASSHRWAQLLTLLAIVAATGFVVVLGVILGRRTQARHPAWTAVACLVAGLTIRQLVPPGVNWTTWSSAAVLASAWGAAALAVALVVQALARRGRIVAARFAAVLGGLLAVNLMTIVMALFSLPQYRDPASPLLWYWHSVTATPIVTGGSADPVDPVFVDLDISGWMWTVLTAFVVAYAYSAARRRWAGAVTQPAEV
jgi:hypothetical protein